MIKFYYFDLGGGISNIVFLKGDKIIGSAMIDYEDSKLLGECSKVRDACFPARELIKDAMMSINKELSIYYKKDYILLFNSSCKPFKPIFIFYVNDKKFTDSKKDLEKIMKEVQNIITLS